MEFKAQNHFWVCQSAEKCTKLKYWADEKKMQIQCNWIYTTFTIHSSLSLFDGIWPGTAILALGYSALSKMYKLLTYF